MAAYVEACIEEADGDAAFIAKAMGDIARAQGMTQVCPLLAVECQCEKAGRGDLSSAEAV